MNRFWWILLCGCSSAAPIGDGVPVRKAYEGRDDLRLTMSESPSPLAARREIPLYYPPEVFAVYVPARLSRAREIMIGEHWVFFKLKDGGWFPERIEEEPTAKNKATGEDVEQIRKRLTGVPFVVPHE
jgi:hypothetical protein